LKACAENLGGKNVSWLPTAVDTQRYPIKSHGPKDSLVLGWIGSSSNHPYLEKLSGVLPQLAQEFPNLKILVISDQNFQMEGIPVEYRPWSETTEIKDILEMDVGLMPLTEDPWTLGKCALKAIQYMAAGIPAVCSDVGANREVIENGVDGFLVKRDAEWIRILRELLRSPEKRSAVGFAARKKVEENFDIKKTFKILLHALESFS
jgi:glycosyltransferase involved in cell wall biosynthesis